MVHKARRQALAWDWRWSSTSWDSTAVGCGWKVKAKAEAALFDLQCRPGTLGLKGGKGMNTLILIADDDAKHLTLLTDVLQAEGHTVIAAGDGKRAITLAQSARPSLIIMDVQMPLLDGFAAINALKAVHETRFIPTIAITALAMGGDRERLLAAGFDGYLSKPISLKQLRVEVNHQLGCKENKT